MQRPQHPDHIQRFVHSLTRDSRGAERLTEPGHLVVNFSPNSLIC